MDIEIDDRATTLPSIQDRARVATIIPCLPPYGFMA
jgi:hypothetical protein